MSKSNDTAIADFTGWRALIWPIHNFEMKKFVPMALIMFCLLFNYTVLRDTKDTLIVNSGGAHVIPYLKGIAVTGAAILFVILYAKATNAFSRENLFYVVVSPFLIFFGLFGFVLYPMADTLHPTVETVKAWHAAAPWAAGFIDSAGYWTYSLFYVLAEIWGSAMIALVFWQFANHVVRMSESKRFYGLFAVIGNAALILSGYVVFFCSQSIKNFLPEGTDSFLISIYLLMGFVVLFGCLAMFIFRWMHTNVLNDKLYFDPEEQLGGKKKKKEKPSLAESAKLIFKSSELLFIALLIMAYGVTINLAEVQWKHQLKLYYDGDKGGYNGFMGLFSLVTGILTIFFGLFVGQRLLRSLSWFSAAIITPAIIFIGGSLFFMFIMAQDIVAPLLEVLKTDAVTAATFLGAAIVIIAKSVKYTLFDPTKEMAYIPLDEELKSKGKAAVDVIGGRAGKAAGGWIQMAFVAIFATKDVVTFAPASFLVFAMVAVGWLYAVKGLAAKIAAVQESKRLAAQSA